MYDQMFQRGVPQNNMRISALIHETAWHAIDWLQEFEPITYDRFCRRISGVGAMSHAFDYAAVVPKTLPFMFKDWKEYRDYLLEHIVKPEYRDVFKNRWRSQEGDEWFKLHVKECILNDVDGTVNWQATTANVKNAAIATGGKRQAELQGELEEYLNDK